MKSPPHLRQWPGFKVYRRIKGLSAVGIVAGGALFLAGLLKLASLLWSFSVFGRIDGSLVPGALATVLGGAILYWSCMARERIHLRIASYCLKCGNNKWTEISRREDESTGYSADFGSPKMYSLSVSIRHRCDHCGHERTEWLEYSAYSREEIERRRTLPMPADPDESARPTRDEERRRAVARIEELEMAGDVDGLLHALQGDYARGNAALALGRLGAVQSVERLCHMLMCANIYDVGGYSESKCVAGALETLGDAETLPRKILRYPGLTGEGRYRALYALSQVRFENIHREGRGRILKYPIRSIRRLCEEVLRSEPDCKGARAVLDTIVGANLLRPSARDSIEDTARLLRPEGGSTTQVQAQLLRATDNQDTES